MQDEYVEINGIPTKILTFGKWIDEPFKKNDELILCITGECLDWLFAQEKLRKKKLKN